MSARFPAFCRDPRVRVVRDISIPFVPPYSLLDDLTLCTFESVLACAGGLDEFGNLPRTCANSVDGNDKKHTDNIKIQIANLIDRLSIRGFFHSRRQHLPCERTVNVAQKKSIEREKSTIRSRNEPTWRPLQICPRLPGCASVSGRGVTTRESHRRHRIPYYTPTSRDISAGYDAKVKKFDTRRFTRILRRRGGGSERTLSSFFPPFFLSFFPSIFPSSRGRFPCDAAQ